MPIMVPPTSPGGVLRFQIIDPNNVTRELSRDFSPNLFVEAGSANLGAPTYSIADIKYPSSAGSLVTQINTETRILSIPILIYQESLSDLVNAVEDLYDWFATGDEESRTPIKFRVTRPDDTIRQVIGYYTSGLGGDTKVGAPGWTRYVVELYCPDPYPTDIANSEVVVSGAATASFGVFNPGKFNVYPIIQIRGPWNQFNLINTASGKNITSNYSASGAETIFIDTRPSELRGGNPSVYDQAGTIRWEWLNPVSEFWPLIPGTNVIAFTTNFYNASTQITVTYLPRYRSLFR